MKVNSVIPRIKDVKTYNEKSASRNKVKHVTFQKKYIENPEVILGGTIALFFNTLIGVGIFLTAILMDTINNNNDNNKRRKNNISSRYKFFKG